MKNKPIIIVPGQLDSIFFEIFFKILNKKKFRSTLLLICDKKNFKKNAKQYNYNDKFKSIKNLNEIEKK